LDTLLSGTQLRNAIGADQISLVAEGSWPNAYQEAPTPTQQEILIKEIKRIQYW
jgi:hypothetical protein